MKPKYRAKRKSRPEHTRVAAETDGEEEAQDETEFEQDEGEELEEDDGEDVDGDQEEEEPNDEQANVEPSSLVLDLGEPVSAGVPRGPRV